MAPSELVPKALPAALDGARAPAHFQPAEARDGNNEGGVIAVVFELLRADEAVQLAVSADHVDGGRSIYRAGEQQCALPWCPTRRLGPGGGCHYGRMVDFLQCGHDLGRGDLEPMTAGQYVITGRKS